MAKFVICDDEAFYLEKIKKLVEQNLEKAGMQDVEIITFTSGGQLLDNKMLLTECQAVFLDINMQDCNGVDIAYKVKQRNPDILLIFVTAYMDYVLAGYRVEAFRFLLKDDLEGMMRECIFALLDKLKKEDAVVQCTLSDGVKSLKTRDILYIESFKHSMVFHGNDAQGTTFESSGSLGELENRLKSYGFYRVHKSFLINMRYVQSVERYQVRLANGECIPIPRAKYQAVREEYFKIVREM